MIEIHVAGLLPLTNDGLNSGGRFRWSFYGGLWSVCSGCLSAHLASKFGIIYAFHERNRRERKG